MSRLKAWPAEAREEFEERAAIMEYDGGLPRQEAERKAYRLVGKKCGPVFEQGELF